jgi:hemerythrin
MAVISWKEFYSVGNPSLDAQHQQIIGVINELYDAMEKKSTQQVIKPILDSLVKYTFEHFKREEEAMVSVEYPDFTEHKALHDKIRQKTLDLKDNADFVTGQNLLAFLKEWWVGHIQTEDKKYAPFLEASVSSSR